MPEDVLLIVAGAQVPLTPLLDIKGSIGADAPLHNAEGKVNVGINPLPLEIVTIIAALGLSQGITV